MGECVVGWPGVDGECVVGWAGVDGGVCCRMARS